MEPLEQAPDSLTQAETDSRVLAATGARDQPLASKWLYYQRPVRDYLRRLGCAPEQLDDLAQEALIQLAARVIPRYDPQRGAFRPYLKQALRNLLRDRLRADGRETHARQQLARERRSADAPHGSSEPNGMALLEARAREMFELFLDAEPAECQRDAQILEKWVVDRLGQDAIAEHFGLRSSRQVRTLVKRAAARFAVWMEARLHPDDLASLLGAAPAGGVRGLFSHLSRKKRLTVLALLERIGARAADGDAGVTL